MTSLVALNCGFIMPLETACCIENKNRSDILVVSVALGAKMWMFNCLLVPRLRGYIEHMANSNK